MRYLMQRPSKVINQQTPQSSYSISMALTSLMQCSEKLFFYVLLTVHLSIILVINQLNAQILVL